MDKQISENKWIYLFIEAVDVRNSSTSTGRWWRRPQLIQSFTHQKDSRRSRPSNKLMWTKENCIIAINLSRSHLNFHVGSTSCITITKEQNVQYNRQVRQKEKNIKKPP